jgi:hypothetical protein
LEGGRTNAKAENVESHTRKNLLDKMFDAAMKEKFSQLSRKYNCELVLEIWTQIVKGGGVRKYFGKGEWETEMTVQQALFLLDEYCDSIESLIQKRLREEEGRPFLK